MGPTDCNKLEFLPTQASESVLPSFDLRSLGGTFAIGNSLLARQNPVNAAKLSGRCTFVVREGFDPIDLTSTGRVIQGRGDLGITLRNGSTALSLTAGNLSYVAGLDDPMAASQVGTGEGSMPSLKATLASEYKPDCFAAASYDIRQKKPEFTLAWSGSTATDQASLVLHADPLMRTYKLGASVAFPGVATAVGCDTHDKLTAPTALALCHDATFLFWNFACSPSVCLLTPGRPHRP